MHGCLNLPRSDGDVMMTNSRRNILILAGSVFLAMSAYIFASALQSGTGYPLDDAWIHQTYARNLAQYGEWSFIPGLPSGGSTAPLWSALIAPAYLAGQNGFVWTMLLGGLGLLGLAWFGEKWFEKCGNMVMGKIPLAGLFLAFEWHLVWAAASGMETILYAAAIVLVFWQLADKAGNWLMMGLLAGLIVWLRPDGLTLLGPIAYVAYFSEVSTTKKLRAIGLAFGGFLLGFLPYLVFNHFLAGSWWPNTFFAKQAEYAIHLEAPLLSRFFLLAKLPVVGAGVLLLPGFIWVLWRSVAERNWTIQSAGLWWVGYTLIYALRLPVDYQHGRYLMPAMPVFFVLGLMGTDDIWRMAMHSKQILALLNKVWRTTLMVVLAAFLFIGATQAYALDVGIINTEMVAAAKWIAGNTPTDALIAAHDIGALGYYGGRDVLDLAGLISPDVIPFIRDEKRLAIHLDEAGVTYLMTFPGWYVNLTEDVNLVFKTKGKYAPSVGGENMCIYEWGE
jgi:hypothetical protein